MELRYSDNGDRGLSLANSSTELKNSFIFFFLSSFSDVSSSKQLIKSVFAITSFTRSKRGMDSLAKMSFEMISLKPRIFDFAPELRSRLSQSNTPSKIERPLASEYLTSCSIDLSPIPLLGTLITLKTASLSSGLHKILR